MRKITSLAIALSLVLGAQSHGASMPDPPVDLDRRDQVTMVLREAPLSMVLEAVVLTGNWELEFDEPDRDRPVDALLEGTSMREALDAICSATGLEYSVKGRTISVKRGRDAHDSDGVPDIRLKK